MKKFGAVLMMGAVMSMALVGCGEKAPALNDGTYEGAGKGMNGDVNVSVEVSGGKISAVNVGDHAETEGISDPAIAEMPEKIVAKNGTDVEVVSGATMTSNAIIEGVNKALEDAK